MTAISSLPAPALVAVGGALGAVARWAAVAAVLRGGARAEVGTLLVNGLGCLLIGVLYTRVRDPGLRLLVGTGMLGGFTTFSTYAADVWGLAGAGRTVAAIAYAAGTVALALGACALGQWLGGRLP